jgi:hypothetical protein
MLAGRFSQPDPNGTVRPTDPATPRGTPLADGPLAAYAGAGSCAGLACHGSPLVGTTPQNATSASWWFTHDPHTRAYTSLLSARSQQIAQNLAGEGGQPIPAQQDSRCLACHSLPELAAADTPDSLKPLRLEGVSCEACHGPSRLWNRSHTAWGSLPADELKSAYAQSGMLWLNDPLTRSGVCVGCHVGAPAEGNVPARIVDHDLIAAGHPRLAFELTLYQRRLPPHWREFDRQHPQRGQPAADRVDESFEPALWWAGQISTARAWLRLAGDSLASRHGPELAHFDCYGCHRPIGAAVAEQPGEAGQPGWSRGSLRLNQWQMPLPLRAAWPADPSEPLEALRKGLLRPTGKDAEPARLAARQLSATLDRLAQQPPDPAALTAAWGKHLAAQPTIGWDDAAQTFLALCSWQRAGRVPGLASHATRLRELIAFPQADRVRGVRFDSPAPPTYTAAHQAELLRLLRQSLGGLP